MTLNRMLMVQVHDIETGYGDPLRVKATPDMSLRFLDETCVHSHYDNNPFLIPAKMHKTAIMHSCTRAIIARVLFAGLRPKTLPSPTFRLG